jgi:hypothetical protein
VSTVTNELAEGIYQHLSEATASGGPYAAIYDLSATKHTPMPTNMVRSYGHRPPSIPMGRKASGCGNGASHIWAGSRVPDVR